MHLKMGRGWKVRDPSVGKTSSQLEGRSTANSREESFLESPKSGQEKKHYKDIISMSMRLLEETI